MTQEFVESVITCISPDAEFDSVAFDEARQLVFAALRGRDDDEHSNTIKKHLTGLTNGYGCWLSSVEAALIEALERQPDLSERYRGEILGSFQMAKHWLFEIEGHNARHEAAGK